jgi:hypothetical protein
MIMVNDQRAKWRDIIQKRVGIIRDDLDYNGATYEMDHVTLRWTIKCTENQLIMILLLTGGVLVNSH